MNKKRLMQDRVGDQGTRIAMQAPKRLFPLHPFAAGRRVFGAEGQRPIFRPLSGAGIHRAARSQNSNEV